MTISNVFLARSELRVEEASGVANVEIVRTGSLDHEVTITYGITGDTATEGQDFIGGFGTVTMPAGAASVTVPVTVINDTLGEPTEIFVFSLVNVTGATLWAPRTQRISILDDETPAPPPPAEPPLVSNYNVQEQHIVEGLNQPIKIQFSPVSGNLAYVAEKGGVIKLIDTTTGSVTTVADFSAKVNNAQDRGLLDIVLDPNFASNHYIYSFYVVDPPDSAGKTGLDQQDGAGNRYAQVVRMTLNDAGTAVVAGSEKILVGGAGQSLADISGLGQQNFTDPAFSGAVSSERYNVGVHGEVVIDGIKQDYIKLDSLSHAGGAMAFGPDGALYVAIGDGTSFDYADPRSVDVQNINSLSGKVLRIDPATGLGLPDNPFVTGGMSLASNAAKVFQLGLRNSFSSAFDSDGKLILSNTGWNSWEMINTGGAGANFGWPYYEGGDGGVSMQTPNYQDFDSASAFYAGVANGTIRITPPFRAFSHNTFDPGFQVQAITGSSSVYTGNVYPAELKNDWLFLDFSDGEVYSVDTLDSTKVQLLYKTNGKSVPIDFKQGADGYLYYVDIAFGVFGKLKITSLVNTAPVVAHPVVDQASPEDAAWSFTVPADTFTDADGDTLSLAASQGDSSPLPGWLTFNPGTRTLSGIPPADFNGHIALQLTASDGRGGTVSTTFKLAITPVNDAPVIAHAIVDQASPAGIPWSFTVPFKTFIDADGDALSLAASQGGNSPLPGWLAFNPETWTFSGTPPADFNGKISLQLTASDGHGGTVTDSFQLDVTAPASGSPGDYFTVARWGATSQTGAAGYSGPVGYLQCQYLGSAEGEVVLGTARNDFINLLGGDDAANGGAGNDVIDGGTGSNFLSGGDDTDVFFLDGRSGQVTWSTLVDWQAGEQLALWGWQAGVSRMTWIDRAGASGYEGVTLHADLDGNGTIDASVTWTGLTREQLPTPMVFAAEGLLWFFG